MPEPRRLGSALSSEVSDRDSRTEALLVDGLDRYFNGDHEEAIHLWTRVLFLDRSHARARAYIDRARTAMAERQRRADEMLHATGEWLAQGDADRARALLSQAEANDGDDERTAGLRLRLERLERLRVDVHARPAAARPRVQPSHGSRTWWVAVAGIAVASVALVASTRALRDWMGIGGPPTAARSVGGLSMPAPPSTSEVAFIRARTLVNRGRLAEALRALDRVAPESEQGDAAEALRLRIQQLLLAAGGVGPSSREAPENAGPE